MPYTVILHLIFWTCSSMTKAQSCKFSYLSWLGGADPPMTKHHRRINFFQSEEISCSIYIFIYGKKQCPILASHIFPAFLMYHPTHQTKVYPCPTCILTPHLVYITLTYIEAIGGEINLCWKEKFCLKKSVRWVLGASFQVLWQKSSCYPSFLDSSGNNFVSSRLPLPQAIRQNTALLWFKERMIWSENFQSTVGYTSSHL